MNRPRIPPTAPAPDAYAAPLNLFPYESAPPIVSPLQLLRIADICRLLRISKPTFWRMRHDPTFPQPADISPSIACWYASDIQEWISARRRPARQRCSPGPQR